MKKYIIGLVFIVGLSLMLTGCMATSTESKIAQEQNKLVTEANRQVGMPNVKEFYEKKMAKQIIELRDNSKLICYAYTKNEMTGKYVFEGKCMGFGLPYSTQYTNPQTLQRLSIPNDTGDSSVSMQDEVVPQADPNGLYMPSSASATWLMMINENTGKVEAQYYEPNIVVTQSKKPSRLCEAWSLPSNY